jgi:hypothetical protein
MEELTRKWVEKKRRKKGLVGWLGITRGKPVLEM